MKKKILILPISLLSILIIGFFGLKISGKKIAIVDKKAPETSISTQNNNTKEINAAKTWTKIAKAIPTEKEQTFTAQFVTSQNEQPVSFSIPVYGVYTITEDDVEDVKYKTLNELGASAGDIIIRLTTPVYANSPTGEYIKVEGFSAYVIFRVKDQYGNLEMPGSSINTVVFNEQTKDFISIPTSAYSKLYKYIDTSYTGKSFDFPTYPVTVDYANAVAKGFLSKATANYSLS